jgi:hypothetical protein
MLSALSQRKAWFQSTFVECQIFSKGIQRWPILCHDALLLKLKMQAIKDLIPLATGKPSLLKP